MKRTSRWQRRWCRRRRSRCRRPREKNLVTSGSASSMSNAATVVEPAPAPRHADGQLRAFLEMIRFSHTLFALPFALAGAVLAWRAVGRTKPLEIFIDVLGLIPCMIFARSTAMAVNRFADRTIDAANPRTKMRHLPS